MTIYEFFDTVNADYTAAPPVPIFWTTSDVSAEELSLANGNPYLRITEMSDEPRQWYQDAVVISRLIHINIFQSALPDQRGVPRDKMQAVYDQVFNAPDFVNACTYGDEDFLKLQYVLGLPPAHDTTSGGLAASLRFRLWFARRAKA
jgi:hypothetical protein